MRGNRSERKGQDDLFRAELNFEVSEWKVQKFFSLPPTSYDEDAAGEDSKDSKLPKEDHEERSINQSIRD